MENNEAKVELINEDSAVKATVVAQEVLDKAQKVALELVQQNKSSDERVGKILADALKEAFGEHANSGRFVDISRIPLICKSIIDTNEKLKEIGEKLDNKYVTNEAFDPVKKVVYGMVGLILVAVVSALIYMVVLSPGRVIVQQSQNTPSGNVK